MLLLLALRVSNMSLKFLKSRVIEAWVGFRSKVLFGPFPRAFANFYKSLSLARRVILQVWGVVVGRICSLNQLTPSCKAEDLIIKSSSGFSPSKSYFEDSFYRLLLYLRGVDYLLLNKLLTIVLVVGIFLCSNIFTSSGTTSVDWINMSEADKVEWGLEIEICSVAANVRFCGSSSSWFIDFFWIRDSCFKLWSEAIVLDLRLVASPKVPI